MTKNLFLNPFLFFLIRDGALIGWDYKNHEQYEIELDYLSRLLELSKGSHGDDSKIDQELQDANLVCDKNFDVDWGWDDLSKIFHIGTQDIPLGHSTEDATKSYEDYMIFCEEDLKVLPNPIQRNGKKIVLPPPNLTLLKNKNLWDVLKSRKTYRSFNKIQISLEQISTLLYVVFGHIHDDWKELTDLGLEIPGKRKSSPSGGALHPSEAYLFSFKIDGLKEGIYYYSAEDHSLIVLEERDYSKDLGKLLCGQFFAEGLSAGIFISSQFTKSWNKYQHSRAYRIALLDVGHLSQTFQLCATALDLHPWLTGMFEDSEVAKLCQINNTNEYPIFFVGVGKGDGNCLDKEIRELIERKRNEK